MRTTKSCREAVLDARMTADIDGREPQSSQRFARANEERRMTLVPDSRSTLARFPKLPFNTLVIMTLAGFVLAASAVSARAQAVYGSVAGVVTDSSGGIVPGATVTVTSVDRQT